MKQSLVHILYHKATVCISNIDGFSLDDRRRARSIVADLKHREGQRQPLKE